MKRKLLNIRLSPLVIDDIDKLVKSNISPRPPGKYEYEKVTRSAWVRYFIEKGLEEQLKK